MKRNLPPQTDPAQRNEASSSSAIPHCGTGFSIDEIFQLTKIDRWFLVLIKKIVDFEEELAGVTG